MRAIQVKAFGQPDVLEIAKLPDPEPAEGEVVVRLHAAGVNPVETYVRSGQYARLPELPYIPGSDGAGLIESVGAGVSGLSPGDRVYVATLGARFGTYAERIACPAAHVHALPTPATFAQGAALGVPYVTAYRALFQRGRAKPGETVLVHGASGGVGTAAVQLARAHGLRVIGTAGSDAGAALVRQAGAHDVLDHGQENYLSRVIGLSGGRGVDLVVEMLANVNLDRDAGVVAPHGRIVLVGNRGRIEIDPRQIMAREAEVLGVLLFAAPADELKAAHAALVAGLERGVVAPVVGRELPLAEAPEAHRAIMQDPALGKLVLTM